MSATLQILTTEPPELAQKLLAAQQTEPGCEQRLIELFRGEPDYTECVRQIFAADSVQVW